VTWRGGELTEASKTREIEQRTFEGDKQAAVKIAVVDVQQVVSLITDRLQPGSHFLQDDDTRAACARLAWEL
jgi:hypothetical protein